MEIALIKPDMKNLILKSISLAAFLLYFSYDYYLTEHGHFMSVGVVVAVGIIVFAIFLVSSAVIAIMGYLICNKIFPSIVLALILPFAGVAFLSWLVYAGSYAKSFELTKDYVIVFKGFLSKHLAFVAICTTLISLVFYYSAPQERVGKRSMLRNNLLVLLGIVLLFMYSIYLFYNANLIKEPQPEPKYALYKKLGEVIDSQIYEVEHLPISSEDRSLGKPYIVAGKNELIIYTTYYHNGGIPGIETIYRIDKNGKIIESVDWKELLDKDSVNEFEFKDGILKDPLNQEDITWIFNGSKKRRPAKSAYPESWKIKEVEECKDSLHMVHFNKTHTLQCEKSWQVKYTGTKYYELMQSKGIIKLKIDSIFPYDNSNSDCPSKEVKMEYYASDQLNFSLLRLDDRAYYIIRERKK